MRRFFRRKNRGGALQMATVPRKRVVPLWRMRRVMAIGALLASSMLAGGGVWAVNSGMVQGAYDGVRQVLINASAGAGFTIEEVLVTGRSETARSDLVKMMDASRGQPILAYDFHAARERVETLPWVLSARVERLLPDTIVLHIIERRPLALWQNQGKFSLIDEEGEVITTRALERFRGLMHVVGDDAPANVGPLMELLATQPEIMNRVKSAVRIGARRWDLRLNGGVDVRLPEDGAPEALARLARFERESDLLSRDIRILDLRVPDRVILRRQPEIGTRPEKSNEKRT